MSKALKKKIPEVNVYDEQNNRMAKTDPRNINGRLYECISKLLDNFDDMSPSEQIRCIAAIAGVQIKYNFGGNFGADTVVGATVRKYAKAFKNAASKRKAITGEAAVAAAIANNLDDDDDGDELGE